MSEPRTGTTTDEYPLTHTLIARRAAVTPGAVAVVEGEHAYSYAELDARADRMAGRLRALGAGADVPVAVCLPRGYDLVATLLAVWKTGSAYVPLDPGQPAGRLARLVEDAGAGLAVSGEAGADGVRSGGARVVPVATLDGDGDGDGDGGVDGERAGDAGPAGLPAAAGANAAYILHTSGSTGAPKGVVITHTGIGNRIDWAVRGLRLTAADRVLHKTAPTFDAHCWEIFAPLVAGGSVAIAPAGAERDPAALVRATADSAATVLQVVPSVLRLLVEEDGWDACGALRVVCSAGEPLHAELAQRLLERTDAELWNTYGPTECAIDVTAHRFDPAQRTGPVPIGRPIEGIRLLVTDPAGAPVGVGTPGELFVGGAGVARGYAGRPDLTADRFVPDPFAKDGSRLYRTGDRVRWRADGVLEYLGRLDDQVKINGVRIEPAEVEAALSAHPAVRGAVVTAYTLPDGAQRLAAYVQRRDPATGAGSDAADRPDFRGFLQERLPASHIPGVFVELASFPLNTSGKVDRRALPDPRSTDGTGGPRHRAPETDAERLVAGLWQDVLGVGPVRADDDFFRLGGTSLQLTRLAARFRGATGRAVQLRKLFAATTVEAQAELVGPAGDPGPRPVPRDRPLPLSYGQRALWFLDRVTPQNADWVSWMLLDVAPEAGPEQVQQAVDGLVARHEALRTRYPAAGGEPVQVIDAEVRVPVRVVRARRDELAGLLVAERERGFDLEHGPLLRALLIRSEDGGQVLGLTLHHITTDGWSSAVLEREFGQLLGAALRGTPAELAPLPVQYADYAVWQRERLTPEVTEREIAHWKRVLDGCGRLELPTDRPRPPVRDGRGAAVVFTVPARTADALGALGKRHAATPFMTLLTAFAAVLGRHAGQWDVPVGTPTAGRGLPELDGVVGFFLNSLVLRCRLAGEMTYTRALERVRDTARDAFAHQELPFELLVEELVPDRDLSRTPLYQVAFDLHDEEFSGRVTDEADVADLREGWRIAHADLTLMMRPTADGGLFGAIEYATSLFDEAGVERMARHLQRALAAVAADPDTRLDELPLLDRDERLTTERWGTAAPLPAAPRPVPEAIAEQAARTPTAPAVTGAGIPGGALSYGELDARANRIAHQLRALGAGPETVIGVLLDRGEDLHAAMLGTWRAGAAYVPLSPAFPDDRIAAMLEAAGARTVITRPGHAGRLRPAAEGGPRLLDLTAHAAEIDARPAGAPDVPADPDRLAYVIFTSGSTGRPKGVGVPHRGLANHLAWAADTLAGAGTGGSAVFSSTAFDLVVPNLWAPLLTGQRVHLLPEDLDLSELGDRLAAGAPYSFLKMTPGHLEILTHQLTDETAASLAGTVVAAGEALPGALAGHWARLLGPGRLINEYGPTEASVGTCVQPVTAPVGEDVVPIGGPLPGMVMRVLDERLRPVPAGAVGELHVGGTGVARGYLGRPAATADCFVPDPFGPPGSRLYRTGDLVRWLPGGAAAFRGRNDDQVKIRGHRVETGEVRAVLAGHPALREAVVTTRREASGELALTAHYVPADAAAPPAAAELRDHCARLLPDYMIPAHFTAVPAVPLNANGKLDRAALPEPADAEDAGAAPTGLAEKRICVIWTELLGREAGVHDNFFRTGGNSILAIRLIAELQQEFDVSLAVRAVFENPTVAGQARVVEELVRAEIDQLSDVQVAADSAASKEHQA